MNKLLKLKNTIKILLAILLIWILVKNSLLNFKLLLVFFNQPLQLFYIFNLMILNVLLSAWRWFRLNSVQKIGISYRDTFFATYVGLTFNNLLLGSVGGDLIRINYLFKRIPQQKIVGTMSVFADRLCGLLGVFFTLCFIGLIYNNLFLNSTYLLLFLKLCTWMSVIAGTCILIMFLTGRFSITQKIQEKLVSGKIAELIMTMRIYKKSPWVIIECIGISILIQLLLAYIVATISHLFSFNPIQFLHFAIANLITQLASLLPISPGGIGVGEMAFAKSIIQLNPGKVEAYATIYLAYRILMMVFSAPGILIFLKLNSHVPLVSDPLLVKRGAS